MKFFKIMFLTSTFLGTAVSISSQSWLGMWIGLEINLLSFIPILSSKNLMKNESTIKYFIIQTIASSLIMISVILSSMKSNLQSNLTFQELSLPILMTALMMKMGMAPFHFWFPEVMEGQSWINCLMILTWQKLAPMILFMYNMINKTSMLIFICSAILISGTLGINQISLRKIMAYSSINHMSWMISSMMIHKTIWILYFLMYSSISLNILMMFKKFKISYLNQLFQNMNYFPMVKIILILNFLSLSSIPPFLGFVPKWLTIQSLVMEKFLILPITMILMTMINVFMYMRMTLSTLILNSNNLEWNNQVKKKFKPTLFTTMNVLTLTSTNLISLIYWIL